MLANRQRILQKMEEFDLDVIIASHSENVSYYPIFRATPLYVSLLERRELRPVSGKREY